MIYRHHIDLRIAVDIVEPVRADAGRREVHRLAPAQGGKDILADVLIGEGNEFLNKVLLHLVQNDLLIVQFQLPFVGIDIAEPEADEIIRNEVETLSGLLRILLCDRRCLFQKVQIDQRGEIGR